MATLSPNTLGRAGTRCLNVDQAAAAGGDKITNTGSEYLYINNLDGSNMTLTMAFGTGAVVDGVSPTNKTVTILAGEHYVIGPFSPSLYNDANGQVAFTYSAVTSLTVACLKIPGIPT